MSLRELGSGGAAPPGAVAVLFPELVSFGALFSFAVALETVAGTLATEAAEKPACAAMRDQLLDTARRHEKRGRQLERLRRERLNEVVLQPIGGMDRSRYLPELDLSSDGSNAVLHLASLEERSARFYEDTAIRADGVLGGVGRTLDRLAEENREIQRRFGS
jgi:hypothetical protein